jgi:hypothetical protein
MVLPASGHDGLNTHAHSVQAQPWKFGLSVQTSLRRIDSIATSGFDADKLF